MYPGSRGPKKRGEREGEREGRERREKRPFSPPFSLSLSFSALLRASGTRVRGMQMKEQNNYSFVKPKMGLEKYMFHFNT